MDESRGFIWKWLSGVNLQVLRIRQPRWDIMRSLPPSSPHRTTRGRQPHLLQVAGSPEPHEPTHLSSQGRRIGVCKCVQGLRRIRELVERPRGPGQEGKGAGAPSPAATESPTPRALRRPPPRMPGAAGAPRA